MAIVHSIRGRLPNLWIMKYPGALPERLAKRMIKLPIITETPAFSKMREE